MRDRSFTPKLTAKEMMTLVKKEIIFHYGSSQNFLNIMSIQFRSGMNIMPMLRYWEIKGVDGIQWRFARGEPNGYQPGTIWVCLNEKTDSLFIRFHSGTIEEVREKQRTKRLADISTKGTKITTAMGKGKTRRFEDGLAAAVKEAEEKGDL